MKARWWILALCFLGGPVTGQDGAQGGDYPETVAQGQQATAADPEALRVQALVRESEEAGVYQDGELEKLEILPPAGPSEGDPAPVPEPRPVQPPVPRYSDE